MGSNLFHKVLHLGEERDLLVKKKFPIVPSPIYRVIIPVGVQRKDDSKIEGVKGLNSLTHTTKTFYALYRSLGFVVCNLFIVIPGRKIGKNHRATR